MAGWIAGAYALVAALTLRPVAGHFAWSSARAYQQREPDGGDWMLAAILAFAAALVWPVMAFIWLAGRYGPAVGAERLARLEERERHVREMEKALNIDREVA